MKNLNKKISAVALASMVVLGGVAVSSVQSFAAPRQALLVENQEIQDKDAEEVQKMIKELGFSCIYRAIKSSPNKNKLIEEAAEKYQGSKFFRRGSMQLSKSNPKNSLRILLQRRQAALVVKLKNGNYVLIEGLEKRIEKN